MGLDSDRPMLLELSEARAEDEGAGRDLKVAVLVVEALVSHEEDPCPHDYLSYYLLLAPRYLLHTPFFKILLTTYF